MDFLKKSKFAYFVWVFLAAATLLMLVKIKAELKGSNRAFPPSVISVSGEGKVFVKPDIGMVSMSVTKHHAELATAQRQATEAINSLTAFLKLKVIEEKDIKTVAYNIGPRYTYGRDGVERFRDYEVAQSIDVKIRDVAMAGDILAGAATAGADKVGSLRFAVDDPDAAKAEARALAVQDAREKAKSLSKSLGVRLKKITSYYENEGGYPGPIFYEQSSAFGKGSDAIAVPSISTGENEIRVSVSISYEI